MGLYLLAKEGIQAWHRGESTFSFATTALPVIAASLMLFSGLDFALAAGLSRLGLKGHLASLGSSVLLAGAVGLLFDPATPGAWTRRDALGLMGIFARHAITGGLAYAAGMQAGGLLGRYGLKRFLDWDGSYTAIHAIPLFKTRASFIREALSTATPMAVVGSVTALAGGDLFSAGIRMLWGSETKYT